MQAHPPWHQNAAHELTVSHFTPSSLPMFSCHYTSQYGAECSCYGHAQYAPDTDCGLDDPPKKLNEDVYAAQVLISRNECIAVVRIANFSDESFDILAGTELGNAKIAHIVTSDDSTSVWSADTAGPGYEHIQSVIDSLPGELSVIVCLEDIELLHTYQDVFSKSEYDLGRTSLMEHAIDTGNARPIKQGLRRQPQTSLPVIDTFTENMERQHIIEKSA